MSIKPIKRKRVSDEVLDQIKAHIMSGEWAPGTKIPGELELTGMFGVSRVSVREAIHRLVGMGILSIKRGEGTFVSKILPKDYFNALLPILMIDGANITEMMEFRSMIEVESTRLAAIRSNEEDTRRMKDIINRMEAAKGDYVLFAQEDLNFHISLALAAHNSVVVKVSAIIHDMLQNAMEEIVSLMGYEGGIYYHKKILEAIINRDEKLAAKTMKEHIDMTIEKVLEYKSK